MRAWAFHSVVQGLTLLLLGLGGGCTRSGETTTFNREQAQPLPSPKPKLTNPNPGPATATTQPGPNTGSTGSAGSAGSTGSTGRASAPKLEAEPFVLIAGGDVNLGRGLGQRLLRQPDYNPFRKIAPLLATADLRFVNLESQLSDQNGETQRPSNRLVFTGPPAGAGTLKLGQIDLVSLANNHAWDYGKAALFETFQHLQRVTVAHVGAQRQHGDQAYEPTVLRVKGWSLAFFAVTHIWNQGPIHLHPGRHHVAWARFDKLGPKLAQAKKNHDLVIVSYHGGAEYIATPMPWTRKFIRMLMYAGVDLVLGHHPHVPQGIAWHHGRPIIYSLGNLVFPMHRNHEWTGLSFLARLTFRRQQRVQLEVCPYRILGDTPQPFTGPAKPALERSFRHHLSSISKAVGGSVLSSEITDFSCFEVLPPKRKSPIPIY